MRGVRLLETSLKPRKSLAKGICIDSTKEPKCLFDFRGFGRIDVIKIQGHCKSIITIKIEEYEFGVKRYVQSKNPYVVRSLNPTISCLKLKL